MTRMKPEVWEKEAIKELSEKAKGCLLTINPDLLPRLVAFQGDLTGYGDSFAAALIGEAIAEIADKRVNWRPKTESERDQEALIKSENEKYAREK